jgi:hypothetical protein
MDVIFAFPGVNEAIIAGMDKISLQGWLIKTFNENGYYLLCPFLFGMMGWMLYKTALKKSEIEME